MATIKEIKKVYTLIHNKFAEQFIDLLKQKYQYCFLQKEY